jgi:hypothetical protein
LLLRLFPDPDEPFSDTHVPTKHSPPKNVNLAGDVTEEEARRGGLDGPTIVVVNSMIRSISKIDDYKMVSRMNWGSVL